MVKRIIVAFLVLLVVFLIYVILEKHDEQAVDLEEVEQIREKTNHEYCEETCDWEEECIRVKCVKGVSVLLSPENLDSLIRGLKDIKDRPKMLEKNS